MPLPTHFTLNTGAKIPAVGFGTWQAAPHEVEKAVEIALREGGLLPKIARSIPASGSR